MDAILTAAPAEVRTLQERNFAATMDAVCASHAHYRAVLAEKGLSRADFRSLDDLAKLPLTRKADLAKAPDRFLLKHESGALEEQVVWETLYTTGSTGAPTPFVSTTHDFHTILTTYRRMLEIRGVGKGDILANLYPLTQYPQGAYIRVMNAASALHIPVVAVLPGRPVPNFQNGSSRDEVVETLERCAVTAIWGVPSYVRQVLRRAVEMGRKFPALRHLLLSGEAMSAPLQSAIMAEAAAVGAPGAVIRCSYGSTEMQGGFIECQPGSGYHNPSPEEFFLEILDPKTGEPVPDGTEGLVVFTHLNRRGTVLLRYVQGDLAARSREPCPHCGATVDRIVTQPRRIDDLVKVKGMLVNPAVLQAALEGYPGLAEYQVRVVKSDPADPASMDALELLHAGEASPESLAETVKRAVGVTPILRRAEASEIVDPGRNWKAKRFVDLRPAISPSPGEKS